MSSSSQLQTQPPGSQERPPRDSASVVLLRDSTDGLQVLLMRRSMRSSVLGGAYVFPGGKLEASDGDEALLARLDQPATALQSALGEPRLPTRKAASLFVAAIRETAEEVGVFLCDNAVPPRTAPTSFAEFAVSDDATLSASALAPWSRWITPRNQTMIERRFDTRFFLAQLPAAQDVHEDGFEATHTCWMTPRAALQAYYAGQMTFIPPQIISLFHLSLYKEAGEALQAARRQGPPVIQPELLKDGDQQAMCYPGDPSHTLQAPAFPEGVPTRLIMQERRFMPPGGTAAWSL